jgi:hypothetical protein
VHEAAAKTFSVPEVVSGFGFHTRLVLVNSSLSISRLPFLKRLSL